MTNLFLLVIAASLGILCHSEDEEKNFTDHSINDSNLTRQELTTDAIRITSPTILEEWQFMETNVKKMVQAAIKYVLPSIMEASTPNISSSCIRDYMKLIAGLSNIRHWAFSFLDSTAKAVDGIMSGTMSGFGAFDQCINTEAINERRGKNYGHVMFRGKYCTLDFRPPLPPKQHFYKLGEVIDELKNFSTRGTFVSEASKYAHFFHFLAIRIGICVPSECSKEDISEILKPMKLFVKVKRCEIKEDINFTPIIIVCISLFSFFGLLLIIGTCIDCYTYYNKRKLNSIGFRILLAFSAKYTFTTITNTKMSPNGMRCLHGMKFLSLSWIILGHTYLNTNFQIFRGLQVIRNYSKSFAFQVIVNGSIAVDTFFLIGGILVCYLTVKHVKEHGKPFNITLYIVHRIFRFLPVYLAVIGAMFVARLIGSGPMWHDSVDNYIQACQTNWWTNLLFINNFVNTENMCLPHSWYIACDMQLHVCALLILLPLLKWPKVGLSLSFLGIVVSMVSSGVLTYVNNFPPAMLFVHPDPVQRDAYQSKLYFTPFSHSGPYCIGIIVGYFLATTPKIRMPKAIQFCGWCLAIFFCMSVLFGVMEWNNGRDPTILETIFYSSCNRIAWAIGVAWVIVCCITGHAGIVNYILSWKMWIPLSRLSYISFLIHPLFQIAYVGYVRSTAYPSHFFYVWLYFGHLIATYGAAFIGSMLVETPFVSLERILLKRAIPVETSKNKSCVVNNEERYKKTEQVPALTMNGNCLMENGEIAFISKM